MTDKKQPGGDYPVGYCRPPRGRQFKKGASGNASGRPKGGTTARDLTLDSINLRILEEGFRPLTVREDGREVKMPMFQAVLRQRYHQAAKGNSRAAKDVLVSLEQAIKAVQAKVNATQVPDLTGLDANEVSRIYLDFIGRR